MSHLQEPSETCLTWSGELLRAIQEVFAREQENAELQSRPYGLDLGDYNVLFKRLEKVIKEQVSNRLETGLCFTNLCRV